MIGKLPIVHLQDVEANRANQSTVQKINEIVSAEILDGRHIKGVSLSIGANDVEHKLGRQFQGYMITKQSSASSIYNASGADESIYLRLSASAVSTIDLWVF